MNLCYQDQIDDNEVTQGVRAPISGVGNTLDGGGGCLGVAKARLVDLFVQFTSMLIHSYGTAI